MKHRAVEIARRLLDKVSDVVTGREAFAGAGDQHGVDFRITVGLLQRLGQATVHRSGQGVFLVRAIEAQGQQTALAFQQDGFGHGGSQHGWVDEVNGGEGACSRLSAQRSQGFGAAAQPSGSKLPHHKNASS